MRYHKHRVPGTEKRLSKCLILYCKRMVNVYAPRPDFLNVNPSAIFYFLCVLGKLLSLSGPQMFSSVIQIS